MASDRQVKDFDSNTVRNVILKDGLVNASVIGGI